MATLIRRQRRSRSTRTLGKLVLTQTSFATRFNQHPTEVHDFSRWMFDIRAGTGSPTVPEGAILLTSERYATSEDTQAGAHSFMEEAKRKGPGEPVVIMS